MVELIDKKIITIFRIKKFAKLDQWNINIFLQSGACGIPPLLVQRYAEELKQDLNRVALVLDQVRAHKLATVNRPVVSIFLHNFLLIKVKCIVHYSQTAAGDIFDTWSFILGFI